MGHTTFIYRTEEGSYIFCNVCVPEIGFECLQKVEGDSDQCQICGYSNNPIIQEKMYLHSSKDTNYELFHEFSEKHNFRVLDDALRKFLYTLYEVTFDVEINTKTGEVKILKVNGLSLCNHDNTITYR